MIILGGDHNITKIKGKLVKICLCFAIIAWLDVNLGEHANA